MHRVVSWSVRPVRRKVLRSGVPWIQDIVRYIVAGTRSIIWSRRTENRDTTQQLEVANYSNSSIHHLHHQPPAS